MTAKADRTPQRLTLTSRTWLELLACELETRYGSRDSFEEARSILVAITRRAGWRGLAPVSTDGYTSSSVEDLKRDEDDVADSGLALELRRRPR